MPVARRARWSPRPGRARGRTRAGRHPAPGPPRRRRRSSPDHVRSAAPSAAGSAHQCSAATAALAAHEALGGQHAQGVANGVPTHPELRGQLVFARQHRAWPDLAAANHLAQTGFELAVQRAAGRQVQRRCQRGRVQIRSGILHVHLEGTYIYSTTNCRHGLHHDAVKPVVHVPAPEVPRTSSHATANSGVPRGLSSWLASARHAARDAHPVPPRQAAQRPPGSRLAADRSLAVLTYVLLRPLVGLGHELSVCGVAALLHTLVGTDFWQPVIGWLGLDPIYMGAAVRAAGGVQIAGLAVSGPIGAWLHALAAPFILAPDHVARAAGVSMVGGQGRAGARPRAGEFRRRRCVADRRRVAGERLAWPPGGRCARRAAHSRPDRDQPSPGCPPEHRRSGGVRVAVRPGGSRARRRRLVLSGPGADAGRSCGRSWSAARSSRSPMAARRCVLLVCRGVRSVARRRARSQVDRAGLTPPIGRQIVLAGTAVALVTAISPIGALAFGSPNWAASRAASAPASSDRRPGGPAVPTGDGTRARSTRSSKRRTAAGATW